MYHIWPLGEAIDSPLSCDLLPPADLNLYEPKPKLHVCFIQCWQDIYRYSHKNKTIFQGTCDTTAFAVVPLQRVNVLNVFACSAVLWNVPFSTINMIHYSWWVTLFCSSWKQLVRQANHTVSVEEKSRIHQIPNKDAFSDIRCQAEKTTLNLDSGNRDEMADWSHKHLKITSEA